MVVIDAKGVRSQGCFSSNEQDGSFWRQVRRVLARSDWQPKSRFYPNDRFVTIFIKLA